MAKISILIVLLLQFCTMMQGLPPCSEYYTQNETLGQIVIPPPIKEAQLYHLKVGFNTEFAPFTQLGLLQPDDAIQAVQQGRSLLYLFRLAQAKLTKIWFNNRQLCSEEINDNTTTVEGYIGHVVYPICEVPSLPSHQNSQRILYLPEVISNYVAWKTYIIHKFAYYDNGVIKINNTTITFMYGEEIMRGDWPWLVALFVGTKYKCTGTILTSRHVITAAHCLKRNFHLNDTISPSMLMASLGRFRLHQFQESESINREIESYTIHPDYAHTITGDSDLAILTLKTPVEFTRFIRPVCLWTGSTDLEDVVNSIGWLVGWGEDESGLANTVVAQMARVPIVNQETCLRSHPIFNVLTSERTFCGGARDFSGPCNGDSGSGLMLFNADRYQLRGIVSRALGRKGPLCDLLNYVVYVDVAKYIPWIREQISTT